MGLEAGVAQGTEGRPPLSPRRLRGSRAGNMPCVWADTHRAICTRSLRDTATTPSLTRTPACSADTSLCVLSAQKTLLTCRARQLVRVRWYCGTRAAACSAAAACARVCAFARARVPAVRRLRLCVCVLACVRSGHRTGEHRNFNADCLAAESGPQLQPHEH